MSDEIPSGSKKRQGNPCSSTSITSTSTVTISEDQANLTKTASGVLAEVLECPICYDYVIPPILQCQDGHLVCSNCRARLKCCPTCRGPLGNIRNLAMEKIARTLYYPCKFHSTGCKAILQHTEKRQHEEVCEFRPYLCPCPGATCRWQGSLEAVIPHLEESHKSIHTSNGTGVILRATNIHSPGNFDWVLMQSCFEHRFWIVLQKREKYRGHLQFFAIVQFIGPPKQAEKFAYRLELIAQDRRLIWESKTRSISECASSAITHLDCLVFDASTAELFTDKDGHISIYVTVTVV